MAPYTIAPCTIADSAALSHNNISAFWEDPTWVLSWRNTTLEQHIDTTTKRYPRRLINDRATSRHQKAVDPETGRLLGYARWVLPLSSATPANGEPVWAEAVVPAVGAEEEAEIRRVADAAPWNPIPGSDALDIEVGVIKREITGRKPYLCLDYLAVHPQNQGKGVATALVESGMKEAEKLGLDIFVLAFKRAWGVYDRLGFRVERELVQDDSIYGGQGEYAVRYVTYQQNTNNKSDT